MATPVEPRRQIVEVGLRLQDRGFLAGSDGNMSLRLNRDTILITPAGQAKGRLAPDDLVVVGLDGQKLEGTGNPTTEMAMHLVVYRARPEINACVHTHPPYATAFAVSGVAFPDDILPEVVVFVGSIPLCEYAPPGTEAVPRSLMPYIETRHAFLLRNHGLLTIGRSLEEASNRHETVEHYAHILWLAKHLGDWNRIPKEDFQRLLQTRQQSENRTPVITTEAGDK